MLLQKVSIVLIFNDNVHEAITENWSEQFDELYSIQKRKGLETTCEKY